MQKIVNRTAAQQTAVINANLGIEPVLVLVADAYVDVALSPGGLESLDHDTKMSG
jgi:hypothetical protein